jgi:hypothetical protein
LVALVRFADRDSGLGGSWRSDRLEARPLVACSRYDCDAVLDEIVDFAADWIRAVCREVCCDREVQDVDSEFA